jgi:branched-chain amino acid transport system substrate-binding protein
MKHQARFFGHLSLSRFCGLLPKHGGFLALVTLLTINTTYSETPEPIRIGYVGSLSSFAASYGQATLEGAQLAVEELNASSKQVELTIEDDQSIPKNSVSSYVKLTSVNRVQGVIGGTWWANAFVKNAERDGIPLLSCETLYNEDAVAGSSYFILHGDLRKWVRVYEPLVQKRGWHRGAIVRFTSGFGATLEAEMKALFSTDGRIFAGAVEYSDVGVGDVSDIVLRLRKLKPEVVYIDSQPRGLANILRKMADSGMENVAVLTNSIIEDVITSELTDLARHKEVYFTRRVGFNSEFQAAFQKKYGRPPLMNADLGYYSVFLLLEALRNPDPIQFIKAGLTVRGVPFSFDEHNVYSGVPQRVMKLEGKSAVEVKEQ